MGYLMLLLGLALWWAAHLFRYLAPKARAALGLFGTVLIALVVLAALWLMTEGYRSADWVALWTPPAGLRHLNNLLMLLAFYVPVAALLDTRINKVIRNPLLTGMKAWALAHLLVRGDLASLILFGGLMAWAVVMVILRARSGEPRAWPGPLNIGREIGALLGAVVLLGAVGWIHGQIGPWPFG